jgi:predicted nucleic acid-binding protein
MRWVEADGLEVFDLVRENVADRLALLEQYQEAAMDLADASLVLIASRLGICEILTIDRRGVLN